MNDVCDFVAFVQEWKLKPEDKKIKELNEAKAICKQQIRHFICETEELEIEGFTEP